MKFWPFKSETREANYTDAVVSVRFSPGLKGRLLSPDWQRPLSSQLQESWGAHLRLRIVGCVSDAIQAALRPETLAMIGRSLIRRGEIVFLISTDTGGLELYPCADWDISGGVSPALWTYRVSVGFAFGQQRRTWTYQGAAWYIFGMRSNLRRRG